MRHVQPLLPILLPYHLMHEQVTNQRQNEVFQLKKTKIKNLQSGFTTRNKNTKITGFLFDITKVCGKNVKKIKKKRLGDDAYMKMKKDPLKK